MPSFRGPTLATLQDQYRGLMGPKLACKITVARAPRLKIRQDQFVFHFFLFFLFLFFLFLFLVFKRFN